MPDFLLELFSEEIPARMQAKAAEDLQRLVTNGMVEQGLTYAAAAAFATPRRLTLSLTGLPEVTPDVREERKGPRTDAPEKALEGFLRSTGLTKDQLEARDDKKGEVWFAVIEKPGRSASDVLAEIIPDVIRNFPWPRSMRWGTGDLRWVRPLHSIMAIILNDNAGNEIVPVELGDLKAGDVSWGHRFMGPKAFTPASFDDYVAKLEAQKVILDPAERAARIEADAETLAFAQGMEVVADEGLLREVAGLVEWPVVLMGEIEDKFLGLPPEVLQTSMKEHQKFFSVRNPKTGRIEKFITVANIETADNGATILAGNQRVLAARLSDALFFWENDLRTVEREGMEALAAPLANVTFHNKLGSEAERIDRIAALSREIAPLVGADADKAEEAARIVKADLSSEMVYEFPELQGSMGKYYARHAGLDDAVAEACETHRSPLGPSDDVPTEPVAVAVSLADKIDTLTGFWAIDEKPTGSKDPFALRRAALGVVRTCLETGTRLSLRKIADLGLIASVGRAQDGAGKWLYRVVDRAINESEFTRREDQLRSRGSEPWSLDADPRRWWTPVQFKRFDAIEWAEGGWNIAFTVDPLDWGEERFDFLGNQEAQFNLEIGEREAVLANLLSFFADRLKVHLRGEGVRHDVIDACFQIGGQDDLVLLVARVNALQSFVETEDGANLLAGYKRASNILAAEQKKDGVEYTLDPNAKFAEAEEEKALFTALDAAEAAIAPAIAAENFASAMTAMASLRAPIDAFFDKVTVNAENDTIRRNRLCLLNRIKTVMEQVAVFSAIEG
ncbi:MAG: glycine--tRNA ligase subunit beta [Pseudomonadota bacterium]